MASNATDPREEEFQKVKQKDDGIVKGGSLPDNIDNAVNIVAENDPNILNIYQRGGVACGVEFAPLPHPKDKIKRSKNAVTIQAKKTSVLREIFTRYGDWRKWDSRSGKYKKVDCPYEVAKTFSERGTYDPLKVPVLNGIAGGPTVTPDGRVIAKAGYDKETGLFLSCEEWDDADDQDFSIPIDEAREILLDVIREFPFVDDAARAVWVAAVLTSLVRQFLPGAPIFLFDAPVMASGKTLLATLVSLISTGLSPSIMALSRDETELKKSIFSVLLAGDLIVLYDNITGVLASATLDIATTSDVFRDRLLGESKVSSVSTRVLWLGTGNNISVSGDTTSRVVVSRIDPCEEHPEKRKFERKNIKKFVLDNRVKLVNAGLAILKGYIDAGQPDVELEASRFEVWDKQVRAPMVWAGFADPCDTRNLVESNDPEGELLSELLIAWRDLYGDQEVLVRTMLNDVSSGSDEKTDSFRSILHAIAGDGSKINSWRLGKRFHGWEGRICEGMRIAKGGEVHRTQKWKLEFISGRQGGFTGLGGLSPTHVGECQTNNNSGPELTPKTRETTLIDEMLETACSGLSLTVEAFKGSLSEDDISEMLSGKMSPEELRIWATEFDKKGHGNG